jgi:hypothetical protein
LHFNHFSVQNFPESPSKCSSFLFRCIHDQQTTITQQPKSNSNHPTSAPPHTPLPPIRTPAPAATSFSTKRNASSPTKLQPLTERIHPRAPR